MRVLPDDTTRAAFPRRLVRGFTLPWRAVWTLVRTHALWPYLAIPALLTATLVGAAAWTAWTSSAGWLAAWWPAAAGEGVLATAADSARWVASTLVRLAAVGGAVIVAWVASGILASPVHDRLSARLERLAHPEVPEEPFDLATVLTDVRMGITHSIAALLLWAALACPLQLLHLLPGLGEPVLAVLGATLSAAMLARESLDYVFSRRRYGFVRKLRIVRDHAPLTLGLGLGTLAMLTVPVLNLLSLPAAVTAGTWLALMLERDGQLPPPHVPPRIRPSADDAPPPAADDPPAPS